MSFHITLTDGHVVHRHVDHIRQRSSETPPSSYQPADDFPPPPTVDATAPTAAAPPAPPAPPQPPEIHRSVRNVPPPNYLQYGSDFEQVYNYYNYTFILRRKDCGKV